MHILLVSATPFEIMPTLQWLEKKPMEGLRVLVSGVGSTATTWALAQALHTEKPDLVLNVGIAGAFDRKLAIGAVVNVVSERFADLGVEEADGRFSDLFDIQLLEPNTPPYINSRLENPPAAEANFLPKVHGLTVNKVHGRTSTIADAKAKYPDAQVESMEGAAIFYGCLLAGVPFLQIRSISNYVEARNREAWNIPLAIEQLNATLQEMISKLL